MPLLSSIINELWLKGPPVCSVCRLSWSSDQERNILRERPSVVLSLSTTSVLEKACCQRVMRLKIEHWSHKKLNKESDWSGTAGVMLQISSNTKASLYLCRGVVEVGYPKLDMYGGCDDMNRKRLSYDVSVWQESASEMNFSNFWLLNMLCFNDAFLHMCFRYNVMHSTKKEAWESIKQNCGYHWVLLRDVARCTTRRWPPTCILTVEGLQERTKRLEDGFTCDYTYSTACGTPSGWELQKRGYVELNIGKTLKRVVRGDRQKEEVEFMTGRKWSLSSRVKFGCRYNFVNFFTYKLQI